MVVTSSRTLFLVCLFLAPRVGAGDLLSDTKAAYGGGRWDAIGTLHFRGTEHVGGLAGSFESWVDLQHGYWWSDEQLVGAAVGAVRSITGWNGKVSWSGDGTGDVLLSESEEARVGAVGRGYIESLGFLLPNRFAAEITPGRNQSAAGKRYNIVRALPQGADPIELWVNSKTQLVERVRQLTGVDKSVTTYAEFRPVEGLMLPFLRQESGMNLREVITRVEIASVEVNKTPPGGIFDPPPSTLPGLAFPAGQDSVTVTFDFKEGYISFPVSINGMPAEQFGFDTGSTNTIDPKWARAKGVKFDPAGVSTGGGTGEAANGMARVSRIDIGGLRMTDQIVSVTGLPVDNWRGLLGYELARSTVVRIEYPARRITFLKPDSFQKPENAVIVPLRFAANSEVLVEASVDGKSGEFQLDTGQDFALSMNRPFAERNDLLAKYRKGKKGLAAGVGGMAGIIVFHPAAFTFGGLTPAVGDAVLLVAKTGSAAEEHIAGAIGNGILKQFTVTLDYARRMAYFEKNAEFGVDTVPTEELTRRGGDNHGWLGLAKLGLPGKTVEVVELDPEGPAARGGIEVGDEITAIDGRPIAELLKPVEMKAVKKTYFVLDSTASTAAPGTAVTLTIKRRDKVWDVKLVSIR